MALGNADPQQAAILAILKTLRDAGQDKLTVQAKLFAIWADLFPLTAVGFEVGFNDSSYFAKTFKQKMRITAREYRKQHGKDN